MFKEDILKPLGGQCPKCLKQKVQCTCHTVFKVGDWVRVPRTGLIIKLSENEVKYGEVILADRLYKENNLELWQPQPGEWCWFYTKGRLPVIGKYLESSEFRHIGEYHIHDTLEPLVYGDSIEPFIGTLPSFIQDNK